MGTLICKTGGGQHLEGGDVASRCQTGPRADTRDVKKAASTADESAPADHL